MSVKVGGRPKARVVFEVLDQEEHDDPRKPVVVAWRSRAHDAAFGFWGYEHADAEEWTDLFFALTPSIAEALTQRPITPSHFAKLRELAVGGATRHPQRSEELQRHLTGLVADADPGTEVGQAVIIAALRVLQVVSPMFLVNGLVPPAFEALGLGLTAILDSYCIAHRNVSDGGHHPELARSVRELWEVLLARPRVVNREGLLSQVLELRMHHGEDPAQVLATVASTKTRTAVVFLFMRSNARTLPVPQATYFYEQTLRDLRRSGQGMALRTALQFVTKDPRIGVDALLKSVYTTGD